MAFVHILSNLIIPFALPREFVPGFSIARATAEQLAEIRPLLIGSIEVREISGPQNKEISDDG
ncbi:MAG: hypothetical protein ABJF10_29160, partial [Chthoniobacter sp.]|uniref:hypothetical protein n=1 Tax=Chthoniobacter sp. TaxID=2510640 RepID=UPI0032A36597